MYHDPVMTAECLDGLAVKEDGIYVDATFGGGGHSKEILKRLGDNGRLIVFDQDPAAKEKAPENDKLVFVEQNFMHLKRFLQYHGFKQVDGILADLGVSSHQFDTAERGFSFRFNAELDMRMNPSQPTTAATILNTYDDEKLLNIMSQYGEVHNAKTLVRHITAERSTNPFTTTEDFVARMKPVVFGNPNQYFAKVFQALRIEVNQEMQVLKDFLHQAIDVLKPGGRLVVMSYHSLEDRLVKNFIKAGNAEGEIAKDEFGHGKAPLKAVNKKVIVPTDEEQNRNPRSRSAKLRIAEKI